ncbi:MAG: hypothetical protein HOO93_10280 [Methyloglobulus sp.]|nr:hypothetical protein [Methyloglobulus sp.]
MSKIIKDTEIAHLLMQAITHPKQAPWASVNGMSADAAYKALLRDLGYLVARHFGGRFSQVSEPDGIEGLGHTLSFSWDRQVPLNGGIYAGFDTDVSTEEWRKDAPKISELGQLI